uniref:Pre-mRNA-splicing factor SYF2 n=1 Tax=Rousettus aegyptiacus TaxID=9407 RepID=A0A7J8KHP2_ROUAE|nr:SYF2 pre-mRNA splicing factor [Rousettus aegyptiacus]
MVEFVDPALVEEDLESSPLISGPWLFHPKDEGVGLGDFLGPFQFCIFFKKLSGEEFFPTSNSLLHGTHVPSSQEIDRMVTDLEKQIEKRDKYSRRRPYNDDADIDYINERNAKFNKKAERFYGKYTAEIKQNLERGTAV